MRILITGSKGMLARTLQRKLTNYELLLTNRDDCNLINSQAVDKLIDQLKPAIVLHTAGMTAVDLCESEQDQAFQANTLACINLASCCNKYDAKLISFSTDYVFSGNLQRPYHEWDSTEPINIYGVSKLAGENAIRTHCPNHLICRISWLYGYGGPSFLHTMLKLGSDKDAVIKVVRDQIGNPTSADSVADHLDMLINNPLVGTLHLTCEGEASWYEFAKEIFTLWQLPGKIIPCTSEDFPRPARRPQNSRLEKRVLRLSGFPNMPSWQESLKYFYKHYPQG